jgi:hypothetical protein
MNIMGPEQHCVEKSGDRQGSTPSLLTRCRLTNTNFEFVDFTTACKLCHTPIQDKSLFKTRRNLVIVGEIQPVRRNAAKVTGAVSHV